MLGNLKATGDHEVNKVSKTSENSRQMDKESERIEIRGEREIDKQRSKRECERDQVDIGE